MGTIEIRPTTELPWSWEGLRTQYDFIVEKGQDYAKRVVSLIQPTFTTYWPRVQTATLNARELAEKVALFVLKVVAIGVVFGANPTTFMLGMGAAIVFPEHMRAANAYIAKVWNSLSTRRRIAIFAPFPFTFASYLILSAPFTGAWFWQWLAKKVDTEQGSDRPSVPTTTAVPLEVTTAGETS